MRIEAAHASLSGGRWLLAGVKRWHLGSDNPEGAAETLAQMTVETDLTPDKIRDSLGAAARERACRSGNYRGMWRNWTAPASRRWGR